MEYIINHIYSLIIYENESLSLYILLRLLNLSNYFLLPTLNKELENDIIRVYNNACIRDYNYEIAYLILDICKLDSNPNEEFYNKLINLNQVTHYCGVCAHKHQTKIICCGNHTYEKESDFAKNLPK